MRKQDDGWQRSAQAWIELVDEGDENRELVLDPVMLALAGEVRGQRVLDVGCGEGRFCRMLAARGALVTGLDPTPGLVQEARYRGRQDFLIAPAEAMPVKGATFDLVISYVTLIDIPDYRAAIREMARVLRPGGRLLVVNNTSLSTAGPPGGWVRDASGRKLYFPVDDYMIERSAIIRWRGVEIVNWHRPLSHYMESFLAEDLILRRFLEPVPDEAVLERVPKYEDYFRIPHFVVMLWRKAGV